jgi:signal recognition particle subunit SRP72
VKQLYKELTGLLKKQNRLGEALEAHQKYLKQVGKDSEALAEYVIDASNCDLELAAKLALQLPSVNLKALYANELASLDDILDRLESAPLTKAKAEEKPAEEARKKRRRKPIYPKGFDPANPHNPAPNPERWLPKRERAAFRKLNKKKTKVRGAQGEVPNVQGQEVGNFNRGPSTAHTEVGGARKHRRRR